MISRLCWIDFAPYRWELASPSFSNLIGIRHISPKSRTKAEGLAKNRRLLAILGSELH